MACCSRMRAAMRPGFIGAAATRRPCRARKATRATGEGNAVRISGHSRNGDVSTNFGAPRQGFAMYALWISLGIQPGDGDDERISAETRSRRVAAYRSAMKPRSEEHTSELQSRENLVCRLLLEKKNTKNRPAQA